MAEKDLKHYEKLEGELMNARTKLNNRINTVQKALFVCRARIKELKQNKSSP